MKLYVHKNQDQRTYVNYDRDDRPHYIVIQKQRKEDDTGYEMVQVGVGWKDEWPTTGEKYLLLDVEITKSTYSKK